jgi:hypothetical protein
MTTEYNFTFVPQGFTAYEWDNRAFKQNPQNIDNLFTILKTYEKKLSFGKYLSGYFRFKDGVFSDYEDGTYSTKTYAHVRWWETEMKSCHKGCCTKMPGNWDPETRTYGKEDWQKGRYSSTAMWLWCVCQKDKHPDGPFIDGLCDGHPRGAPVPLQSYWNKPPPRKEGWQEFRRISGLGGAEDQFRQIKRKEDVALIVLHGLGHFTVNTN